MSIYKPHGETAHTTHERSSFEVLDEHKTYNKKEINCEEIKKGRPLWLSELRKQNPASTTYTMDSTFGSTK